MVESQEEKAERLKKEGLGNIIIIIVGAVVAGIGAVLIYTGVKRLAEKAKKMTDEEKKKNG